MGVCKQSILRMRLEWNRNLIGDTREVIDGKTNVEFPDEFWVTNWGLKGVPDMINEQEKTKAELEKELKQTTILAAQYKGAMEDCLTKICRYEKIIDVLSDSHWGLHQLKEK